MAYTHGKCDQDLKEAAVRLVRKTGRLIPQVARDLRINEGTGLYLTARCQRSSGTGCGRRLEGAIASGGHSAS
jgi:hypothetical protein